MVEKLFLELCEEIKKQSQQDTGFKEGIKTTSYEYEVGDIRYNMWQGDVETHKTILLNNIKAGKWYDCYGTYEMSFKSELLFKIKKLLKENAKT